MTANIVTTQPMKCGNYLTKCVSVHLNIGKFSIREQRIFVPSSDGWTDDLADAFARQIAALGEYTYVPQGGYFITYKSSDTSKHDYLLVKVNSLAETVRVIKAEPFETGTKEYTIQKANKIAQDLGIPFVPLKEKESSCSIL